jgi:hypothetical protein
MIAGGKATAGTPGSYTCETDAVHPCPNNPDQKCSRMTHADSFPQNTKSGVATVHVPMGEEPVIVVASESIRKVEATVQDWTEGTMLPFGPSAHKLHLRAQSDGSVTIYTLKSLAQGADQLVTVSVAFQGNNAIMYYWRLTPAK